MAGLLLATTSGSVAETCERPPAAAALLGAVEAADSGSTDLLTAEARLGSAAAAVSSRSMGGERCSGEKPLAECEELALTRPPSVCPPEMVAAVDTGPTDGNCWLSGVEPRIERR